MAWVTLRCPRCGAYVGAPSYPSLVPTWVTCPHCSNPLAVVAPRDPAPLFSWEAFPHLYPPLPAPRAPNPQITMVTALLLAGLTVFLAVLAGILGGTALAAVAPATYEVGGMVVDAQGNPIAVIATVQVLGENGFNESVTTGTGGTFLVPGVPAGGVRLNVTAPSYSPTLYSLFLSPVYSSTSEPQVLRVSLLSGPANNTTVEGSVVYSDMEGFLTGVGSGAGVLAIAALVAGVAAVSAWRRTGTPWIVAGGAGAAVVPFAMVELGLPSAFPLVVLPLFALVAAGVTALTLSLVEFAWTVPMETER
jgi:Carboxypeptidase regulatory-like domain